MIWNLLILIAIIIEVVLINSISFYPFYELSHPPSLMRETDLPSIKISSRSNSTNYYFILIFNLSKATEQKSYIKHKFIETFRTKIKTRFGSSTNNELPTTESKLYDQAQRMLNLLRCELIMGPGIDNISLNRRYNNNMSHSDFREMLKASYSTFLQDAGTDLTTCKTPLISIFNKWRPPVW